MTGGAALIDVALPLPVHHPFTYAVEGEAPPPGSRVLVPFRRTERIGWVVGSASGTRTRSIRGVLDVLDDEPALTPELLSLCRWIAEYYVAPLGITLRAALPSVLSDSSRDYLSLRPAARERLEAAGPAAALTETDPGREPTPRERRLLEGLGRRSGPQRVQTLRRALDMGSLWPEIRSLKGAGALRHETVPPREPAVQTQKVVRIVRWIPDLKKRESVFGRAHRQKECYELLESSGGGLELAHLTGRGSFSRSVISGLEEKGMVTVEDEEVLRDPFQGREAPEAPVLTPNPAQEEAIGRMRAALDRERPRPFLLHGVTGSGKTLVYIELLRAVLGRGRTGVVLVPEISLTPQTVARFRAHFGDRVAVLHSALSDGERYDQWRQIRAGEKRLVVGARSAIFAPLPDLGAVVVDEEHEGSYKQSESPRYGARDVAVVRASMSGAVCVLGSATPSLESWHNATVAGKFELVRLPERATGVPLPPVRVVDLREFRPGRSGEGDRRGPGGSGRGEAGTVLSPPLVEAVQERLRRREQVILLLNRRGYSSFVQCRACGEVWSCVRCSVSLTYHRGTGRLLCHHCRHEEAAPGRCSRCGSRDLSFRGLGTEQVERIVAETFPGARISRMDVDTTSGKWSHHEILGRVERGEVDVLLGTQMIAKGLDFPRVTLVGVVNADVGINLPDFRASERAFQLMSQVAGRTGRGSLGGDVLIQTSLPEHYAVRAAVAHDYEGFARRELGEREKPAYPPHVRMANVVVSSPDPDVAAEGAESAAAWIRESLGSAGRDGRRAPELALVGPAPAPIERLHGRWRWHFLLRCASAKPLGRLLTRFAREYEPRGGGDVRVAIDRDPTALL